MPMIHSHVRYFAGTAVLAAIAGISACSEGASGNVRDDRSGGGSASDNQKGGSGNATGGTSGGGGRGGMEPTDGAATPTDSAILFVTQVPVPGGFVDVASTFGNQGSKVSAAPRGGDLLIRYSDGTLRNLTEEAGFGSGGMQGDNSIAVRRPSVDWSGTRAVFSMVVGATTRQYDYIDTYWQLYEVTGLGRGERVTITRVLNQPADYNNIDPIYGTDDRIIFTSDRPRNGERHLYPQLDEYEEAPTVTGLWSLNPATGELILLEHSPSGSFTPMIDSFGRVLFTRWDHLQRDQQADADASGEQDYGTFNFGDESPTATRLPRQQEFFPERRYKDGSVNGHTFNVFFPWQINEDGTELETINHIGRHELGNYFEPSFSDDSSLKTGPTLARTNPVRIDQMLQIREQPQRPGTYIAIHAPEFYTHGAGQIVEFTAPPDLPADRIVFSKLTPTSTGFVVDGELPADHTGKYRDPLPMADGSLIVARASEGRADYNEGTRAAPKSRYAFRLVHMQRNGDQWVPGETLTAGIRKTVSWWDPDALATYDGELWELHPTEVRSRARPARRMPALPDPEARIFSETGVDPGAFRAALRERGLGLAVSRNVTTRDEADRQQPFNLRVAGSATKTTATDGRVYDVAFIQFVQADQIRGIGGMDKGRPGRRVLGVPMHGLDAVAQAANGTNTGPAGSVVLGSDGSMAALVPARRAMSWQLTDPAGKPVVRERYWLSFQPGEIRVCASCHGVNSHDQAGEGVPANPPEALRQLLQRWKAQQ
jgi:hypothetical protein